MDEVRPGVPESRDCIGTRASNGSSLSERVLAASSSICWASGRDQGVTEEEQPYPSKGRSPVKSVGSGKSERPAECWHDLSVLPGGAGHYSCGKRGGEGDVSQL